MIIVWFSAVLNHHNYPLCDALSKIKGVELYYIQTRKEKQERKDLGYHSYKRDYVIDMTASKENEEKAHELAMQADVMVGGVYPIEFLKDRMKLNKLTFRCHERMFKGGPTLRKILASLKYNVLNFGKYPFKKLYYLAIARTASDDYRKIGFYRNKKYLWGYFPPFIEHDIDKLIEQKQSERINIMFAGRFIWWKHPEFVLKAVKELYAKGKDIHLILVGTGTMEEQLKNDAKDLIDKGVVEFVGSKTPEEVREYMEKSNILAFTSTSEEGWGAVLNEAMNSGCAVVASATAGASTILIQDGKNGLAYYKDNYAEFFEKLSKLVDDKNMCDELGKNAYYTVKNEVNAEIAAQRFYNVCRELLYGEKAQEYKGIMEKTK